MTVHDFQASLNAVKAAEPLCDATWRAFFGNRLRHVERNHGDNPHQRLGTDVVAVLSGGVVVRLEEKVRPLKDYGDVLLELYSNKERGTPGWARKDLFCDYLAFVYVPTKRAVVFPWQSLRRALAINGNDWHRKAKAGEYGFRLIDAQNRGYTTQSLCVPYSFVQQAGAGGVDLSIAEAA